MNLNEMWNSEYVIDRYLSHLSFADLNSRARYLIENLTTLELNGKIGIRNIKTDPGYTLMRKFTHVVREFAIRNETFAKKFLKESSVPNAMRGSEETLRRLNEYAYRKQPHLIKFGDKEYLEKLSIKVSLASTFDDPSLNPAQRDDELRVVLQPDPNGMSMTTLEDKKIESIESVELTFNILRDYYVFCSSSRFDVRLFDDFDKKSCLFIYDSKNFSEDMLQAVSNIVDIQDHAYNNVQYYDPVKPMNYKKISIEFLKHEKFMYQNEYRHVYIPKNIKNTPKDLFFELQSAKNYTELICI